MLAINIRTRDIELTEQLESYVENKIGKLDRYLPILKEARIELRREPIKNAGSRFVAQVTCWGGKVTIRGEERGSDATQAIDAVVDVLYRQIARFKGKRYSRARQADLQARAAARADARLEEDLLLQEEGEALPLPDEVLEELQTEEASRIVRVKQFPLSPMGPEEAIEQMELLGHTFFVFWNATNDRVNVVYQRLDGNFGLLDPQLS
ncbi:MAG: ribosome-associated translation inhibitor RaiA [Anaerolineae bacterium]|nr:ribosome-associated translation inhibitor RaiA [Anaerolineae bacterium]